MILILTIKGVENISQNTLQVCAPASMCSRAYKECCHATVFATMLGAGVGEAGFCHFVSYLSLCKFIVTL